VLNRAAENYPDQWQVWQNLARLTLAEGDGEGAMRAALELRRLGHELDRSLLEALLEHAPGTRWAFDHVKLALTAEQRWPELFDLYERALEATSDPQLHADLLDEAAVAARDVAQDRAKATGYWERYLERRPADPRVDLALERLYEQPGEEHALVLHLDRRLERVPV
jgi:tetratricopeptide (TPR) repeat protein